MDSIVEKVMEMLPKRLGQELERQQVEKREEQGAEQQVEALVREVEVMEEGWLESEVERLGEE